MTQLSPAAQAVLNAINKELDEAPWDISFLAGVSAAAVLLAVADQVVPEESEPSEQPFADPNDLWPTWYANKITRRNLLNIATELKAL
jgi:hypothetical protein